MLCGQKVRHFQKLGRQIREKEIIAKLVLERKRLKQVQETEKRTHREVFLKKKDKIVRGLEVIGYKIPLVTLFLKYFKI